MAELEGEPLAERARRALAAVCDEVVVADGGRAILPGAESVPDGPGQGPAAGILGAAARHPERALLVLACDLPGVPAALLERIAGEAGDWVVPRRGRHLEPLCALYRPPALAALAARVRSGDLALHRLAGPSLRVRYLEAHEFADLGDPSLLFRNVNTREELASAAQRLSPRDPPPRAARRPPPRRG